MKSIKIEKLRERKMGWGFNSVVEYLLAYHADGSGFDVQHHKKKKKEKKNKNRGDEPK
jgi:hypothetical protein